MYFACFLTWLNKKKRDELSVCVKALGFSRDRCHPNRSIHQLTMSLMGSIWLMLMFLEFLRVWTHKARRKHGSGLVRFSSFTAEIP